jgi:hypothetical protein
MWPAGSVMCHGHQRVEFAAKFAQTRPHRWRPYLLGLLHRSLRRVLCRPGELLLLAPP